MSFTDFNHGIRAIGSRTNASGAPVDDLSAREDALVNRLLHAGYFGLPNAFQVVADGTMTVRVGSGEPYVDVVVVESSVGQQPPYLVRLDQVDVPVQLGASGSQARVDRIYVVVEDDVWDGSGRALPRIAYRAGTPGGGAPGPDPSWRASLLLASIAVAGSAPGVSQPAVTDERRPAGDYAPRGTIRMHSSAMGPIPSGWQLCDGTNGTPDLRNRFVVGAGGQYDEGNTGGVAQVTLTPAQMPAHVHTGTPHSHAPGSLQAASNGAHVHNTNVATALSTFIPPSGNSIPVHRTSGNVVSASAGAHTHSLTGATTSSGTGATGSAGGGESHENRPPYFALTYIAHR